MAERTTRSERGGQGRGDGNGDFRAFLKSAPTLEDASSQESTIISGLVFQAEGERFAITTADGQTYESPIGRDGEFYLENLPRGRHAAIVDHKDAVCRFTLETPVSAASLVDVGTVRCVVP